MIYNGEGKNWYCVRSKTRREHVTADLLRKEGYHCDCALDAATAAEMLRSDRYELLIADIKMPGNPQLELIKDLPNIAQDVPVILVTGYPSLNSAIQSVQMPVAAYLVKPVDFSADIVIHSASKFINGHGTALGGAIIDTGNYNWRKGKFEQIKRLSESVGQLSFLSYLRNVIYRDLGGCPAPMNSFLMLQGLETLPIRMAKHCDNAMQLAEFLQGHPKIKWVNYPGLRSNRFNNRAIELFGGHGGGLLTFGLGNRQRAFGFIDSLRLARNAANLGDAKTLVIHPASTIFHEFSAEQRQAMEVTDDMIRVSVGIEDFKDIKADFEQAIDKTFGDIE